jgi:hypothetical protein
MEGRNWKAGFAVNLFQKSSRALRYNPRLFWLKQEGLRDELEKPQVPSG